MRRIRSKIKRPRKLWDKTDIDESKEILKEYGLSRKKEIWKAESILRNFRRRARELIGDENKDKEKILLSKMIKFGLLKEGQGLDDVLSLGLNDILERRLETVIFRKGMANTIKQARQFITHEHITIGGRKTTFPSYIVPLEEEGKIGFYGGFKPKKSEPVKVVKGIDKAEKPDEETAEKTEVKEETPPKEENTEKVKEAENGN